MTASKHGAAGARGTNIGADRGLTARAGGVLSGTIQVPGDKSISHRALMFGALAVGETKISGLLEGEDVLATAAALSAMGVETRRDDDGIWHVWGVGVGGLREPDDVIDFGNSGTAARLFAGLLAGQGFVSVMTGDGSLRSRPMARVTGPLGEMGARFTTRSGGRLPVTVHGTTDLMAVRHRLAVPSAQVKSALLLAGLHAEGDTVVIEPTPTRDHTERMLAYFGADVRIEEAEDGRHITIAGHSELTARPLQVPADPSSAAFPTVAALISPGSAVTITGVGRNPHRDGVFRTLEEMAADLNWTNAREANGEPVADLKVSGSALRGVDVPAERAASMIDEYPVLAMAAACAEGTTTMRGIGELRVKESDRLQAVADGLTACGVTVETGDDWMKVYGCGGPPPGGATIDSQLDHRIAMSFAVLGLATSQPVTINDARPIDTSFPGFVALIRRLGGDLADQTLGDQTLSDDMSAA